MFGSMRSLCAADAASGELNRRTGSITRVQCDSGCSVTARMRLMTPASVSSAPARMRPGCRGSSSGASRDNSDSLELPHSGS